VEAPNGNIQRYTANRLTALSHHSPVVIDPTSSEDLQLLIKDLMNQTGPVIERVKNLLR